MFNRWMLVYMIILSLACAPKTTVKMTPSPELEQTDGVLTFLAKQVLDGEKFEISLNPYGKSVGLVFTPISTDSTHRKLAEIIYKKILSRKEFQERDGWLAFRTDTFYGFATCWLSDIQGMSPVKFAEITGRNLSQILKAEKLWREIMLMGNRQYYRTGCMIEDKDVK